MRKILQAVAVFVVLFVSMTAYASSSEVWKSPTYNFKNIKSIQIDNVSVLGTDVANVAGYDKECEFVAMQEGRQRLKSLSFVKDGADVRAEIEVNAYDVRFFWREPSIWTEEKTNYDYEHIKRRDSAVSDTRTIKRTRTVAHEQPGKYNWEYTVEVFVTVYDNRTNEAIFRFNKREEAPDTRSKGYYEIIKTFWKKFKDTAD